MINNVLIPSVNTNSNTTSINKKENPKANNNGSYFDVKERSVGLSNNDNKALNSTNIDNSLSNRVMLKSDNEESTKNKTLDSTTDSAQDVLKQIDVSEIKKDGLIDGLLDISKVIEQLYNLLNKNSNSKSLSTDVDGNIEKLKAELKKIMEKKNGNEDTKNPLSISDIWNTFIHAGQSILQDSDVSSKNNVNKDSEGTSKISELKNGISLEQLKQLDISIKNLIQSQMKPAIVEGKIDLQITKGLATQLDFNINGNAPTTTSANNVSTHKEVEDAVENQKLEEDITQDISESTKNNDLNLDTKASDLKTENYDISFGLKNNLENNVGNLNPKKSSDVIPFENLKDKISKKVESMEKMFVSKDKILIQLKPKELGEVEIFFKRNNDRLEIHVHAEKHETKEMLNQVFEEMRKDFKEKQVEIEYSFRDKEKEQEKQEKKKEYIQERGNDETEKNFDEIIGDILGGM